MNAIILSAGRGRRLLPLTATQPKCLLSLGGKTLLEWQLQALGAGGIGRGVVVVGFGADRVADVLACHNPAPLEVHTIFNPRFDEADNLISCWTARDEMDSDFLLLNGDTLFELPVLERLLSSPSAPVAVAIGRKATYDDDDMKVHCDNGLLRQIGKDLRPHETDGESIGMLLLRGQGPGLFRQRLQAAARHRRSDSLWYLSVVNEMAREGLVNTVSVDGLDWVEVDYPSDLTKAEQLVATWNLATAKPAFAPSILPPRLG